MKPSVDNRTTWTCDMYPRYQQHRHISEKGTLEMILQSWMNSKFPCIFGQKGKTRFAYASVIFTCMKSREFFPS